MKSSTNHLTTAWNCMLLFAVVGLLSCQEAPPQRAQRAIVRGQDFYSKQQFTRALLEFRLAQRLQPESPDVYFHLGNGFLATNQPAASYLNFKKALQLDKNHQGATRAMARILASSQNPKTLEQAAKLSESILATNPADPDATHSLAITKFKLGDREEGESLMQGLIDSAASPISATINASKMRLHQRDPKGALDVLLKAESKFDQSLEIALAIGRLAAATGDSKIAGNRFQRATLIAPNDARAWLGLGSFYAQTNESDKALNSFEKAARLPSSRLSHIVPQYLWQLGRKEEALASFAQLQKANPKDGKARARYAQVLRAVGKHAEADELWEKGYALTPKDPDVMVGHAACLASHGLYNDATVILQTLIAAEKTSVPGHSLLARIFQVQGQMELARQEWDEVLKADPRNAAARMDYFQSQMQAGRLEAAAELLQKAPASFQRTMAWRLGKIEVLLRRNDLDAAALAIAEAIKAGSSRELSFYRAQLHMLRNEFVKAREQLNLLLDKPPFPSPAVELLIEAHQREKQPSAILSSLSDLSRRDPQSQWLQSLDALWLARLNKLEESRALLQAMRLKWPDNTRVELQLAQVEFTQGKLAAARALVDSALRREPRFAQANLMMGDIELAMGNSTGAIAAYRKVLEINPEEPDALNNLASCLLAYPAQIDEALRLAEQAKQLRPDDPNTNDTLGWAYYQKGLYGPSIPLLEQSLKSKNPVNQFHLSMALARTGKLERAAREFQAAYRAAPNLPEAKMAREVLDLASKR